MRVELMRKYVSIAIRSCYRSALRHPLLVIMVFLLIWVHRSFPLFFSLLVYVSPVIISTALLLGTLLTFGHPNTPKIQEEGIPEHDQIHSVETRITGDAEIASRDSKKTFVVNRINVNEKSKGLQSKEVKEAKSEVVNQKTNVDKERVVLENHHSQIQPSKAKNDGKLRRNTIVPSHSGPYEANKGSESVSDMVESSSPDASMADIIRMLGELHPLLHRAPEAPQLIHSSVVGPAGASEHSLESADVVNESDDDDDTNQEDIKVTDVEEEEAENVDTEDETAITWTEDDQKNLMNLGTSELERNQRLENLIARHRAQKNMRMMAEKNLVNIRPNLPFNATPISTAKRNPFDLPYDSNENISGSAPSVLLPRRNPFDLPHDPSVGATFQPDSMAFQPRFDVGPSTFGTSRQGRQVFNTGPYVHERVASDVTNYDSLSRQLDELIDSKVSSSPGSESVDSADDDLEQHYHTSGNVTGYQEKTSSGSSSSSFSEATDHMYNKKKGEDNRPKEPVYDSRSTDKRSRGF